MAMGIEKYHTIPDPVDRQVHIVIGGEAGQGLVTVGQILAKALVRSGYTILVTQSYQSRIRGGHNTFSIRVGTGDISAPCEIVDLLVALDADTVSLHKEEVSPHGVIVADEAFGISNTPILTVPFKQLASDRYANIVALGIVASMLGLDQQVVAKTAEDLFGAAHRKDADENHQALEKAFRWGAVHSEAFKELPRIANPPQRLMMNGNEAIALGALSAGLKFYAFYPMTPATPIALALAGWAQEAGIIVEQAEDEIAAIIMALGASFAGAPSMVGTSGGGFALMVEGVSLAAMTETPVVIVVGQRPAPATGLPTRTEQGDLEFILHAGHGEFPRAIFSPGTIESCFDLTRRAFEMAERFQGPIFLLIDQFLADSSRAVAPFALEDLSSVTPWSFKENAFTTPYHRYAMTEDGISPRLLPGLTEHLVVADSDEHTEEGHITEDLSVRIQMVDKRLKKNQGIRAQVIPPEYRGESKPDLLLVCWGSTQGAIEETAAILKKQGMQTATLHFSQVWPLVSEQFIGHLHDARQVVAVEGNATGQMARLIRREAGFPIDRVVLRYDGLPITPAFIMRELDRQG